jgi:hypothetical protein
MIRFRPTLRVNRLRIERLGIKVYDEKFHLGVNIIRGDNSSGKSTVLNFLYYAIGGDVSDWSETALLCSRVLVEVALNGNNATLSRDINDKVGQPMEIFGGLMDDALVAPAPSWIKYPYRRSDLRESFSQALFKLLDIPEATSENSGNVTIHQILRLMYADQLSPIGTLFKFEQFDPPLLRDTVGRLIFGAYEGELYANEIRARELEKELTGVSSELSAISKLLGQTGQILTPSWLDAELKKVESERTSIETQIADAELAVYEAGTRDNLSLQEQKKAYAEVQKIQTAISDIKSSIDSAKFEIADAAKFINDLENKLAALNDAAAVSDAFGRITFQYCPACYSAVEADHAFHACHLCKNPFDSERARTRTVSLVNDTSRQLRQSRFLQKERNEELQKFEADLAELNANWKAAAKRLTRSSRTPSSEARQRLRALQRSAGYLDRQIEDIEGKSRLSSAMEKLIDQKAKLNAEISRLNDRNAALKLSLANRLSVAYNEVEKEILSLLHNDLPREEAFISATSVQFDFASNKLGVNNQSYFSASSRVVLRNSFFAGLFAAATKDLSFRHLRICMLDSIEDKGMQPDRSHNFQRLLVSISQLAACEHQIIFATSMIAPELNIKNITVGHYSTLENPTLAIHRKKVAQ